MKSDVKDSMLFRAMSDVVEDLADLFRKEMKLAREEISDKIASKLRAGTFFSLAGVLAFVVFLLAVQAAVFALATFGFAMHWSCLIVAAALAVIAGIFFAVGQSEAREGVVPDRTVHQIKTDIATAKEILS